MVRAFFVGCVCIGFLAISQLALAFENTSEGIAYFESKVRPVLVKHCYSCHSVESGEANGELRLDSRSAMANGGTRGSVLSVPAPDRSLLIQAIEYHNADIQMPPDGKIPEPEIAILRKWIEMGAPDPRDDIAPTTAPITMKDKLAKAGDHWAYQPPRKLVDTDLTSAKSQGDSKQADDSKQWIRDPIDAVVYEKLSTQKMVHSPDADRRTLIRRLYYDLLGLPPSIDEFTKWIDCHDSDWYEQLVRSLLQSPHFGERMSRRWMDVVRYADNKGYVFKEDREYPHAYRYRDWLIRSFNNDLAYNDFIRYQLIGDQLDPKNESGHLDAMGMITLGRRFLQNKNDIIDDRIDVVSRGLLGVTASCARCHDHKFDPVSTADYYSLHGMFTDCDEPGDEPSPMRLVDKPKQSKTFVFLRGNPGSRGPEVAREFFGFLKPDAHQPMKTGSGRLEMTEGIVDPSNPLTARVYVNRIWGWLTGRPFVDTPSDFGLRCEPPLYQSILDDLSFDFIEGGWSTKKLIERIVLSSTYRQSSLSNPKFAELDPENRMLWRANRRRMDFESYRDAMLKAVGSLDVTVGGKSVVIHNPPFSNRRTVYAYIDRQNLSPIFRSFDFASPDAHVPQRAQTTVPQQSLVLMNSNMLQDMMKPLVTSIEEASSQMPTDSENSVILEKQVGLIFSKLLARQPSEQELARTVEFLKHCDTSLVSNAENCWTYGYGNFDLQSNRVISFERLPRFAKDLWSGDDGRPDKTLGWTSLDKKGGHPGKSLEFCAIRRWTAPKSGEISIRGTLEHSSEEGDGVRATIVLNQDQSVGTWNAKKSKASTVIKSCKIEAGSTIDMVVDCLENESHDSFNWTTVIQYKDSVDKFDSSLHFSGSQPTASTPLQQTIQALLMTNEFCFVD